MADFFRNFSHALERAGRHFAVPATFAKDKPDAGTVDFFIVADRAGELNDFEDAAREFPAENRARLIEQIFETLRGEHGIDIARDGRPHIFEIVIE